MRRGRGVGAARWDVAEALTGEACLMSCEGRGDESEAWGMLCLAGRPPDAGDPVRGVAGLLAAFIRRVHLTI